MKKLIGVGMRASVWTTLQERFGLEQIVEMYGATESNIIFGETNLVYLSSNNFNLLI